MQEFFINNFLTIIFGIVAIIGLFQTFRTKRIDCFYTTSLLLGQSHPDVEIYFKKKRINNLFNSKILVFNSGTEEIRKDDIPDNGYPLITLSENQQIISCNIEEYSTDKINFRIEKKNERQLQVLFDYLNVSDGGSIEILYQADDVGRKSLKLNKIDGEIIGGVKPQLTYIREKMGKFDFILIPAGIISLFLFGIFIIIRIVPITIMNPNFSNFITIIIGILFLAFAFVAGIGFINTILKHRRMPEFAKKTFMGYLG